MHNQKCIALPVDLGQYVHQIAYNSISISRINLVLVSSDRANMYLLIAVFNNIGNVVWQLLDSNIRQIIR